MADLAITFGWGPAELDAMSLGDLAYWWAKAKARTKTKDDDV